MNKNPVEILKELIEFPTFQEEPDKIPDGMKECSKFLINHLEALDFKVNVDELLNVTAEKEFDGKDIFLINTHSDTVPPSPKWKDALNPKIKGKRLIGLGSSDAKPGIAATISSLYQLKDCRFGKLIVQFVNYEDNGIQYGGRTWQGMPFYISNHPNFKADYGVNIEPNVKGDKFSYNLNCTGRVSFKVTTIGKEAHSSEPKKGKNSIYDMMKIIEALREIPSGEYRLDDLKAEMPIHVAEIHGGRKLTIVPAECTINCERRVLPGEDPDKIKQIISSALDKIKGVKLSLDFSPNVQKPYEISKSEYVVKLVTDSFRQTLGYEPLLEINHGRTDSMYLYHMAGIKTVIIGPGQSGVCHRPDEYINMDRLKEFTRVITTLLSK